MQRTLHLATGASAFQKRIIDTSGSHRDLDLGASSFLPFSPVYMLVARAMNMIVPS
jgi:hypothetical protein